MASLTSRNAVEGFADRAHLDDVERHDLQADAVVFEMFGSPLRQVPLNEVAILREDQVDEIAAHDVDEMLARDHGEQPVRVGRPVQVVLQVVDAVLDDQVDLQQVGVAGQDGERHGAGVAPPAGDPLALDAHDLAHVHPLDQRDPIVHAGLDDRGYHLPEPYADAAFLLLDRVEPAGQHRRRRSTATATARIRALCAAT